MQNAQEKTDKQEQMRQMEIVRKNLRFMRRCGGWTREDLAFATGVREGRIASIERGDDFDAQIILRLCHVFGVAPEDVLEPFAN